MEDRWWRRGSVLLVVAGLVGLAACSADADGVAPIEASSITSGSPSRTAPAVSTSPAPPDW